MGSYMGPMLAPKPGQERSGKRRALITQTSRWDSTRLKLCYAKLSLILRSAKTLGSSLTSKTLPGYATPS